jgi:hypothetical protein
MCGELLIFHTNQQFATHRPAFGSETESEAEIAEQIERVGLSGEGIRVTVKVPISAGGTADAWALSQYTAGDNFCQTSPNDFRVLH